MHVPGIKPILPLEKVGGGGTFLAGARICFRVPFTVLQYVLSRHRHHASAGTARAIDAKRLKEMRSVHGVNRCQDEAAALLHAIASTNTINHQLGFETG